MLQIGPGAHPSLSFGPSFPLSLTTDKTTASVSHFVAYQYRINIELNVSANPENSGSVRTHMYCSYYTTSPVTNRSAW